MMASESGNLFLRNDTIFGVCEGLGRDLGINPNFIRVPLAAALIFAPVVVLSIYAALGLVVLATRLLAPDRKLAVVQGDATPLETAQPTQEAAAEEERVLEAA